jgi:hypothetical protein
LFVFESFLYIVFDFEQVIGGAVVFF